MENSEDKWNIIYKSEFAIIDENIFYKAENIFKKRSKFTSKIRVSNNHIFSNLIKCGICKEKNYKGIQERKKNKYICQNYQYKKCQRNIIEEDILIKFFKIYCDKNKILWQPEARKYIDKIIVLENSSFEIYYKDGDTQFYKENIIKFI